MWLDLSEAGGPAATWYGLRTGPWLTTASVLRGPVEVRLIRVGGVDWPGRDGGDDPEALWPADPGPWRMHVGGYPVAGDRVETAVAPDWAGVTGPAGLTSRVYDLRGFDQPGTSGQRDSNPFGSRSAVPWLRTSGAVRPGDLFAAAVVLAGGPGSSAGEPGPRPEVDLRVEPDSVTVVWGDGSTERVLL
jgi:hypothetical protein